MKLAIRIASWQCCLARNCVCSKPSDLCTNSKAFSTSPGSWNRLIIIGFSSGYCKNTALKTSRTPPKPISPFRKRKEREQSQDRASNPQRPASPSPRTRTRSPADRPRAESPTLYSYRTGRRFLLFHRSLPPEESPTRSRFIHVIVFPLGHANRFDRVGH